jgi:hypothetical protein
MVLVSGGLLAGISAAGTPGFETVPDQSPAQLLPPAMVSGVNFHVVDPVHGDAWRDDFRSRAACTCTLRLGSARRFR